MHCNYLLGKGGYVFGSVNFTVCLFVDNITQNGTPPWQRRLCFSSVGLCLSVCLFACLFVDNITQNVINGLGWNLWRGPLKYNEELIKFGW